MQQGVVFCCGFFAWVLGVVILVLIVWRLFWRGCVYAVVFWCNGKWFWLVFACLARAG